MEKPQPSFKSEDEFCAYHYGIPAAVYRSAIDDYNSSDAPNRAITLSNKLRGGNNGRND